MTEQREDQDREPPTPRSGYTATAVLSSLIGTAGNVVTVGLLRGVAWAARGLRVPARNALLADVVPASTYGRAYGFERTMDNLGAIVGSLFTLGLVAVFSVRAAILISVIPGLLAALAKLLRSLTVKLAASGESNWPSMSGRPRGIPTGH
ncbi:MFS transporter [Streptoalloteichus hindustanus]|uniref:Major Facilitator Superfamily protein n=1 Tax=Streptoalloteichus hindustanus TaxID=2017 RepID=A0A1M5MD73_STRHI|nr:MFS transporter [Streptoalloteichus hindustanus]SHG75268.1 Major Facilitator Superfamily protein [Streptoalloteichus hindustanus]